MQDKSHGKRIFGLDIVRAMAILLVMLAHTLPGVQRFPVLGKVTYCCAFFGVDLFFVLSGFLIGGIVIRELENERLKASAGLLTFWKRRWFRTLPNYYLFLMVNVALALWMGTDSQVWSRLYQFPFFAQNLAWSQPSTFFTESWSLAIEEWFYLTFPLVLFFCAKLFRNKLTALILVIGLFFVTPTLLRFFWVIGPSWGDDMQRVVVFRFDSLMFGVTAALISARRPDLWRQLARWLPLGLAVALFAVVVGYIVTTAPFDQSSQAARALILTGVSVSFTLMLPFFFHVAEPTALWARAVSRISILSYALYLCHLPVLRVLDFTMVQKFPVAIYHNPFIRFGLSWIIFFTVATLIYKFFERPMMDLRERKKSKPQLRQVPEALLVHTAESKRIS